MIAWRQYKRTSSVLPSFCRMLAACAQEWSAVGISKSTWPSLVTSPILSCASKGRSKSSWLGPIVFNRAYESAAVLMGSRTVIRVHASDRSMAFLHVSCRVGPSRKFHTSYCQLQHNSCWTRSSNHKRIRGAHFLPTGGPDNTRKIPTCLWSQFAIDAFVDVCVHNGKGQNEKSPKGKVPRCARKWQSTAMLLSTCTNHEDGFTTVLSRGTSLTCAHRNDSLAPRLT